MTEPTSAVLVTFDQLSLTHGALATADPTRDYVVFIESASMLNGRTWHAQRIFFLLSSVAHVMAELRDRGFIVVYLPADTMADGVTEFRHRHPNLPLRSTAPTAHALHEIFVSLGIELVPNDLFLTSREEFAEWASGYKSLTMEYFYRWQRKRLNILIDGAQPVGGQWNFDADNRLPPPRTKKGQPAHV